MRAEPTIELPPRPGTQRLHRLPPPAPPAAESMPKPRPAKRWRLARLATFLAVPALLGAAAGFGGAMALDKVYAARADILFHLTRSGDHAERFLATQAVVARSHAVLGPVAAELGVPVERIDEKLDVDFPMRGAVMRLEFTSQSATAALDTVKLLTQRYLAALRPIESAEGASHQVLAAPFLLDEPVWPRPLQATALGAVLGLAVSVALLALAQQPRRRG
jgi:uncharacterized protein involved in exopolysaccharide biosynthesis